MDTSGAGLIVSTTAQIEDRPVREYLGIVSGDAIMCTTIATDRGTGARRQLRPNSTTFEQRVRDTRNLALAQMVRHAGELGATAIIAVDFDYTTVQRPSGGDLLVITASGTVVIL